MSAKLLELLSALGRSGARGAIAAYAAGGARVIAPLLDALLVPPKLRNGAPVNGRAYFEDEEDCLRTLCRRHPRAFVREVKLRPVLLERLAILSAIAEVPGPTTLAWLLDALNSKNGSLRWLAVRALTEREAPELRAQLERLLLKDRDTLVVFVAVDACRRLGGVEHLPLLVKLSEKPNIGIGTREAAFDAMELLAQRAGVPLPPIHPGPRLIVLRGSHPALRIADFLTTATQVPRGKIIARGGGVVIETPEPGVISFMDRRGDELEVGLRVQPAFPGRAQSES